MMLLDEPLSEDFTQIKTLIESLVEKDKKTRYERE